MKTIYSILLLCVICSPQLLSQTENVWEVDMMSHRSVHYTDSNLITITSLYNRILRSDDGGETFSLLHTPQKNALVHDAYFIDSLRGIACGIGGYLVRTTDAGTSWEYIRLSWTNNFTKLFFPTPEEGYILADSGLLLHTTDAGKTWNSIDIPVESALTDITHNSLGTLLISSADGKVLLSSDKGQTWQVEQPLFSVATLAAYKETIIAISRRPQAGSPQDYSLSFDGGKTWNFKQIPPIPDWGYPVISDIIVYDSLFFRAAIQTGIGPRVIITRNAGETWEGEELEWPFNFSISGVTTPFSIAAHGDKCIVVGENSLIMYYTRTNENTPLWKVRSYSDMRTRSVESNIVRLSNGDIIFGNSRYSTIVASRDSGLTWLATDRAVRIGNSVDVGTFRRIQFLNDSVGYFNGLQTSYLFHTTNDRGNTLSLVRLSPPDAFYYNAFELLDSTAALIFDIKGKIRRVTTKGVLENIVTLDSNLRFQDCYRVDEETVCAIAIRIERINDSTFNYSSHAYLVDKHINNVREIPLPQGENFNISKVVFFNKKDGVIIGHDNYPYGKAVILHTEDGGQTWHTSYEFMEANYGDYIQIVDDTTAFTSVMNLSVDESGIPTILASYVFFTQDKGRSWHKIFPLEGETHRIANQSVRRFQMLNDSIVIAFSSSTRGINTGEILYANLNDLRKRAVSVTEDIEQQGNPYLYITVHPNPISNRARITLYGLYSVPPGRRSLKVYDMLGNQVADISEQIQYATGGFTTTEWNIAGITRGQYFIVFSDGNDARTRNVVVIE